MTTPEEYRAILIEYLTNSGQREYDPALEFTIAELEAVVLGAGLPMPIVSLPEHYLRGTKWFTNLGNVELCNCGALWPCPLAKVTPPIVPIPDQASDGSTSE